jgi:hypothetical protein
MDIIFRDDPRGPVETVSMPSTTVNEDEEVRILNIFGVVFLNMEN